MSVETNAVLTINSCKAAYASVIIHIELELMCFSLRAMFCIYMYIVVLITS